MARKNKKNTSERPKKRGRPSKQSKKSINTGRKKVKIENASMKTLRRRTKELQDQLSLLEMAANEKIGDFDNLEIKDSDKDIKICRHSNESALAFFLEYNYSVKSYKALVSDTIARNCPIYPCYDYVHDAMVECQFKNYKVSETEVLVSLQDNLNKSAQRLCESIAADWTEEALHNLQLVVTLGFDSSSGHTNPDQKYVDSTNESSDSLQSLFVSSFIIIKLRSVDSDKYFWVNPTPQSIRFCRPLRIALEKEDEAVTATEHNRINKEIKELFPHRFKMRNGKLIKIKYDVYQTLFDGKCLNIIVKNNATSRCPECLRTSHKFSNLKDNFTPNDSSLRYGLGLLHCEIKTFEHLLHLSYRRDVESWDVRKQYKEIFEQRKRYIQKRIYQTIGVRVDQILQGHGTTNTGNVARRCFQDPQIFAQALEINFELVNDVAKILLAFKSKLGLDLEKLEKFSWNVYCLYYNLYPWARMSPTFHKLLKHGCDICRQLPLPVAYYAEDANESWHKYYRQNMLQHARQSSRENRILDVFNRAVYFSDPKISLILVKNRMKTEEKSMARASDITEFQKIETINPSEDDLNQNDK